MPRSIKKVALMAVGDAGWQGGIQYISNILYALNEVCEGGSLEIHLFRKTDQIFNNLQQLSNIKIVEHNTQTIFKPWTLFNRTYWFLQRKWQGRINPRLENYLLNLKVDFVFPETLSSCKGRLNVGSWIADFQYHHFPDGARKDINADAQRVISNIANNADKIILSSYFCEQDCLQLFPGTKGKTHVLPFAVGITESDLSFMDFECIRDKYALPNKFIMVANLFAPTKNHQTLFDALGILKNKGIVVPLVCTGNIVDYRNEYYANDILQMITKNKIRAEVYLLGLVPRQDQLAMFRMSTAMVQPSVNEGWSTSVEEAKALGKNLLVSDIPVHKEQSEKNPLMFSAMDASDLAQKIEQLWIQNASLHYPDMEAEKSAFKEYQKNVKSFGLRFLEIASA